MRIAATVLDAGVRRGLNRRVIDGNAGKQRDGDGGAAEGLRRKHFAQHRRVVCRNGAEQLHRCGRERPRLAAAGGQCRG